MAYGNRILVTGGQGMLGSAIEEVFAKDFTCIFTDINEFDVRKYRKFIKDIPSPNYILHLAAETNLEFCESYPMYAYHTNTIGTFNMVEIAKQLDIPIIYMSTAGVFGNTKAEYFDENSTPDPINTYGRSKYYGEIAVQAYPKHWIFRISWAFGGGARDRKFVMKICKQLSAGKQFIEAIDSKSGSPSYTRDVAGIIYGFIKEEKPYGLYHIPTGSGTRYEVACEIVKLLNSITPIYKAKEEQFLEYIATRPKCEVLKSVKGVETRDWKEALKEYIDELVANKSIS